MAIKTDQHNAEWLAEFVIQISEVKLTDVSSSLAMEEIKYTTALPLAEEMQTSRVDLVDQPSGLG